MKYTASFAALSCAALLSACAATPKLNAPTPAVTPLAKQDKPVVALVLGGGGARGFAHIGVIQTLEAHQIKPDLVVGTSAGALVGALYASGKTGGELHALGSRLSLEQLVDFTPSKQGVLDGTKIREFVNLHTKHTPIEQFPTRFAAVATELHSQKTVAFDNGEAGLAVQASSSVPNLFIAPRIPENGGKKYIDGSAAALVPSRIARALGADVVIAVDVMSQDNAANDTKDKQPPATAGITRTDTGARISWGDDSVEIPLDFGKIDSKDAPFNLPIGEILTGVLSSLPDNLQVELPKELPRTLPKSADEIKQAISGIGSNARAKPADLAAADVLITPNTASVAVFDVSGREVLIQQGKIATEQQIDAIKKAIENAAIRPNAPAATQ